MENNIIKMFNLKDDNIEITKIDIVESRKYIHIFKTLKPEFCPKCGSRMHSKGIYKREVNHPILQDGYQLTIILNQRKWRCTNINCNHYQNDEFGFVEKSKQSTNLTPYMIIYELKDLSKTASEVAAKFNVSDTYVHYTFLQYVDLRRLPLPKILCIDEVYLNFDDCNRYCLVLMDFVSGEIIDILPNRNDSTTSKYFLSIPKEERDKVEFLICDMYNPYINYATKYFKNAKPIIDSFHVVQWILNKINLYINSVKKKYQERDEKELETKNHETNKENKTRVVSREVYLLNNYRWLMLKNNEAISYSAYRRYNKKLKMYMDTYDLEKAFMGLDENFMKIRELKENYISFNQTIGADEKEIEKRLCELINEYSQSGLQMFIDFAKLLNRYKTEIVNSFTRLPKENGKEKKDETLRRLSNGPMEGFNRKPKDLKRNSRGFSNFEYTRNRILWAVREDAPVLATPKSRKEVQTITGKTRGKYKKNK